MLFDQKKKDFDFLPVLLDKRPAILVEAMSNVWSEIYRACVFFDRRT
jgi:hypothetical protein